MAGPGTGGAIPGIYERVWREASVFNPDFAINVGDTIEGGKDESAESQWRELRPLWSRYRFPFYFTPGNHDIWSERSLQIYKKETGRPNYYSFNYQDAHFTVLDNSRTLELDDGQLKFLEDDLKARSAPTPIVVFAHIPLWAVYPQWGWGTEDGERALGFLKRFGSVTVLNGHIHQIMQKVEGKVSFHGARSTAFPQPAPGKAPSPGPMAVPAGELRSVLGVTEVNYNRGNHHLAVVDETLG